MYIDGGNILLKVDGIGALGHCESHKTSYAASTKDHKIKAPASEPVAKKSLYKNKTVTSVDITVSANGFLFSDEAELGYPYLRHKMVTGEPVELIAMERGSETPYMKGQFIITSLDEDTPAGEDATYSVTFENSGAPEMPEEFLRSSGGGE